MRLFSFLPFLVGLTWGANNNTRILFQEKEDIFVAYEVIHLTFQVDISLIEEQCLYFRQTIKSALPHYKDTVQLEDMWFAAAHLIKQTCDLQHLDSQAQRSVVKRQALPILAAVIGTVFGIYSFAKIQALSARVRRLEGAHANDLHLLHNHETRMELVERDMLVVNNNLVYLNHQLGKQAENVGKIFWLQTFLLQFGLIRSHVQALNDGWAALQSQRFPVWWILPKTLLPTFQALRSRAEKMGGVLPVEHEMDLYHFPTSYVVEDKSFRVFVHIPVVHEKMRLYKHLEVPIWRNGSYFLVKSRLDHLVVAAKNRVHKEVDLDLLDRACVRMGRTLLCEHLGEMVRTPTRTCLGRLFVNRIEDLKDCVVERLEQDWMSVQLDHDRFLVFAREMTMIFTECPDGSRTSSQIQGLQEIRIGPGCLVYTQDFEMRSSAASTMLVTISTEVDWSRAVLERNLYTGDLRPLENITVGSSEEAVTILDREDRDEREMISHQTLWLTGSLVVVVVGLLMVIVVYLMYRARRLPPIVH